MLRTSPLTGGQVITEELGQSSSPSCFEDLAAAKVVSTKDTTTFVDGAGESADIKGRIDRFVEIEASTSDYDREKLQERLALAGGVAIIRGRRD